MHYPTELYRPSLALLTDLYQLTMGYAAWRSGWANREAVFHLFFRRNPFAGGFAVAAGLELAVDYLSRLHFDEDDLSYLANLTAPGGTRLFDAGFIEALRAMPLALEVDAVPEGTVVFPHEPLLRVRGPIIPCMLAETALLNMINFQTLVATKAARITMAARGEPVLDFGLRRAQGIDGALAASRAAYIGGCAATSNVLAGRLFGIPVRGTHAHSWVMLFDNEPEAFATYADALPHNCVFLVDTYDTLAGVRNAIEVGEQLRKNGHDLLGIRLDSGDLAELSIAARKLLDAAGFSKSHIFASNDLDEHAIANLKQQGAAIAVWGVGTRLVTAHDDPALGGVYKLAAVRSPGGEWQYRIKVSEQPVKTSIPGILQVRRFVTNGEIVADALFDEASGWPTSTRVLADLSEPTRQLNIADNAEFSDLLVPVVRNGRPAYESPPLPAIRERTQAQLALVPDEVKRFGKAPHLPVGLEPSLAALRARLVAKAREATAP